MPCVKNHVSAGNDLETVLLQYSAFLCVTSFFPLASFCFINAFILSHSAHFCAFYAVIPDIINNLATSHFLTSLFLPFVTDYQFCDWFLKDNAYRNKRNDHKVSFDKKTVPLQLGYIIDKV